MTRFNLRARAKAALQRLLSTEPPVEGVIRLVPRRERPTGVVTLLLYPDGADDRGNRTVVALHRQVGDLSDQELAGLLESTALRLRRGELADHPDELREKA